MDTDKETRSVDALEVRSGGEKRGTADGELGCPLPKKKARSGQALVGSVNKVAEMALVLAALAEMRAGRSPTAIERQMMVDARERLARVCECFAPKDVFPREAFGSIIDDLGLNELKEQKLGFRPPKMTISEKLLFTKQKMEKTQEFSVHSAIPSSQQPHLAMAAEGRTPMNTIRISSSDKSVHAQVSSGAIQPAKSVASTYQVSASEVRASVVSGGLPTSLVGKDSPTSFLPRAEKPHLRSDTRSNGPSSYTSSPVQASVPGGKMMAKHQDWSRQTGPDNRLLQQPFPKAHGTVNMEGSASFDGSRVTFHSMSSKPVKTQGTSSSLPVTRQSVQMVQPPLLNNNHTEIGKLVHKLLQPKTGHPTWIPPSREYMNKAITCDVCKIPMKDLDNVLVCDACEKGYHLKCLQSHNQKAIPRGEWHCFQCLSLSNGKPLPPKYGRVTRNMSTHKAPSNSTESHPSAEKKAEILGVLNQKNVIANGTSGIQSQSSDSINQDNSQLASTADIPSAGEMRAEGTVSSKDVSCDKCHIETYSIVTVRQQKPDLAPVASSLSNENSIKTKQISELNGKPQTAQSETMENMSVQSQALSDFNNMDNNQLSSDEGVPLSESHDNSKRRDSGICNGGGTFGETLNHAIKLNPDGVAQVPNTANTNTQTDLSDKSSSDGSLDITWIGNILEVVDNQNYYHSCCINGIVYRLHQYALFPSAKGKLMPSKIQAMWEEVKTGLKWVNVNLCYFPDELPETIGRPCSRESNEVFESNHGQNIMASLLRGHCEVLPPGRFNEENERRSRSGTGATDRLHPIFLCKWFFDEMKGVFRDVLT